MANEKGVSKPESLYEKLRKEILYLELEPGQFISEIETAKRFEVSRTPVRDAFKRLENEGLLEIRSHIGTFVSLIDLENIDDILYMREKLEVAVLKDVSMQITQLQEIRLNYILLKQKELFEKDLTEKELAKEFIMADDEFHEAIFEMAGRSNIWQYLSSIEHHYERMRMLLNFTDKEMLYTLYEEHVQILKSVVEKDVETLSKLFESHLYGGLQRGKQKIFEKPEYFKNFSNDE